jgi:catechol 2,3-dioxygenase-like lactoylglutathione lyase family enzyme
MGMSVGDLDAEEAFLRQLDFDSSASLLLTGASLAATTELPNARAISVTATLGAEKLVLTQFLDPVGRPIESSSRPNDVSFEHLAIVVTDVDRAFTTLQRYGAARVSVSAQTIPPSNPVSSGVRAIYLRDPEGHFLELLSFPPDKGEARWHRASGKLFLGIDHSAIVTSDTARSVAFYGGALGLVVESESLNEGREQEALSAVPGARVCITSLRGQDGPGVELLEYLSPRDGRPFAPSTAADRVHWELTVEVDDVSAVAAQLKRAGSPHDSSLANAHDLPLGYSLAELVRDPDGHTVRLVQR